MLRILPPITSYSENKIAGKTLIKIESQSNLWLSCGRSTVTAPNDYHYGTKLADGQQLTHTTS
jgi:hypothetical protein